MAIFFSLRGSSAYDVFFLTRHEMFAMRLPNHIAVYIMTEINYDENIKLQIKILFVSYFEVLFLE